MAPVMSSVTVACTVRSPSARLLISSRRRQDGLLVPLALVTLALDGLCCRRLEVQPRHDHEDHRREHQQADHLQFPRLPAGADGAGGGRTGQQARCDRIELPRSLVDEIQTVAERPRIADAGEDLVPGGHDLAKSLQGPRARDGFQVQVDVAALQAEHDLGRLDLGLPELVREIRRLAGSRDEFAHGRREPTRDRAEPLELRRHGRLRAGGELQFVDLAHEHGHQLVELGDDRVGAEHVLPPLADGGGARSHLCAELGIAAFAIGAGRRLQPRHRSGQGIEGLRHAAEGLACLQQCRLQIGVSAAAGGRARVLEHERHCTHQGQE